MPDTTDRSIDFDRIRSLNSLRELVERYAGQPLRHDRCPCPVHRGEGANFGLEPDGKHARCWSCGWRGDVIDLVAAMEGITLIEAAQRLDPSTRAGQTPPKKARAPKGPPPPEPAKSEPWQDGAWQEATRDLVVESQRVLWGPDGRPALDWLRGRGLHDGTVRRFGIGFNPRGFRTEALAVLGLNREGRPRGAYVARGVTLPWLAPGSSHDAPAWTAVNVRRLGDDFRDPTTGPKCMAITGSRRGQLYPLPNVEPSQEDMPALLVEGELDALIGWQQAGWLAHVVTIGSASQTPRASALEALSRLPLWLVATDVDAAGSRAAWDWRDRDPSKARRALLPLGKDLNAFCQMGGLVHGWLQAELVRNSVAPEPEHWSWIVANWPHERWVAWRRRSTEIQFVVGTPLACEDIRLADRQAFDELSADLTS